MEQAAKALRIILVFTREFWRRGVLACWLLLGCAGAAHAQSRYQLQMSFDLGGRQFSTPMTRVVVGELEELTVNPVGGLRVYVRAIPLSGVADQALLDLQIYEPRGNGQAQIAALTMTAYLATQNSAVAPVGDRKLVIGAYVDDAAKAVMPAPGSIGPSLPSPQYRQPPGPAAPRPIAPQTPQPSLPYTDSPYPGSPDAAPQPIPGGN